MYKFQSFLIQFPLFFLISCFILWCITCEVEIGKFILSYICVVIIARFFKYIFKLFTNNSKWVRRPKGAKNCGSIIIPRNQPIKSSGFPSGHSIMAGFLLCYGIMFIWNSDIPFVSPIKNTLESEDKTEFKALGTVVVVILGLLIAIHRSNMPYIGINCHTYLQIIIGFLIGVCVGVGAFTIGHIKND